MKTIGKSALLVIFFMLIFPCLAPAKQNLVIASGAGYKSLISKLAASYKQQTGQDIQLIYGNMSRVTAQAKSGAHVDLILGDKYFLENSGLKFKAMHSIGQGKLVAIWNKDLPGLNFKDPATLENKQIKRIAMPDPRRAIYGRAGMSYLENTHIYSKIKDKLLIVGTVPQAASYILTKEVDLAFINLTHALKIKSKIKGFEVLDTNLYSPINIVFGEIAAYNSDELKPFLQFLSTSQAQKIIKKQGLQ